MRRLTWLAVAMLVADGAASGPTTIRRGRCASSSASAPAPPPTLRSGH